MYFATKLRLPHGCPFEIQASRSGLPAEGQPEATGDACWITVLAVCLFLLARCYLLLFYCFLQACYASIGWSIGATLGYGIAAPQRRVVTVVGDGAAQMTVQVKGAALHDGRET